MSNYIRQEQGRCGIEVEGNQCGENTVLLVAPLNRWVCARHVYLASLGLPRTSRRKARRTCLRATAKMGTRERVDGQVDRTDCDPEHCRTVETGEWHGGSCPIFHRSIEEDFVVGKAEQQGRQMLTVIDLDSLE